jgi:hypothetical protein
MVDKFAYGLADLLFAGAGATAAGFSIQDELINNDPRINALQGIHGAPQNSTEAFLSGGLMGLGRYQI